METLKNLEPQITLAIEKIRELKEAKAALERRTMELEAALDRKNEELQNLVNEKNGIKTQIESLLGELQDIE